MDYRRGELYFLLLLFLVGIPIAYWSVGWAGRLLTQQEMLGIQGGDSNWYAPYADAGASPITVAVGNTVYFFGYGSYDPAGDTLSYYWDFGDQQTSTSVNPQHAYSSYGTYTTVLTVSDEPAHPGHSLSDTDSVSIKVFQVTQTKKLWWFNGEDPANYDITITLQAKGLNPPQGTYKWDVTQGTDKVDFENNSDTITKTDADLVTVKSTGKSSTEDDVVIKFTYNGNWITNHALTVYAPDHLMHTGDTDTDWFSGYVSKIWYETHDRFHNTLTSNLDNNENFTSAPVSDYTGETWGWGTAGGGTVDPSNWYDRIQRSNPNDYPTPQNPQSPLGNTKIDHRLGDWYFGSATPGQGVKVATTKWQIYRDHGRHE